MPRKALIKIRRGTEAQLPTLDVGELGFCTDTNKLYIGTPTGNQLLVAAQSVGDMLKSIYDTNNDGIVDNADKLDGYHASSFVLKTGDTMTGDLKVAGDVIAANKLAVGYNNVNAERFRFEYNGSSGRLELWANSSDSGIWVKKVEFPKRQDDNDFSLLLGGNQVWHEGNFDPSTKSNVNHNHNLANLSEKSYNSLTDKPNIPSKVSELENDANYVTQEELGDAGYGDMLKSIYDQNNNGIVDNAEKLGGQLPSYYQPALGYTPVNKAGDTMTGTLVIDGKNLPSGADIVTMRRGSGTNRFVLETQDKGMQAFLEAGASMGLMGTITASDFRIRTNYLDRMSVSGSSGNVGIDTTSPSQKLDVNGKIRMRLQTQASDADDIVATKKYVDTNIPTKVSQLENDRGYVTQEELGDAGYGDMLKSIYDTDNDGKVDAAEAADSVPWTGVTGKPSTFPPSSHTHIISNITGLQVALDGKMSVGPLTWNDLKGVI